MESYKDSKGNTLVFRSSLKEITLEELQKIHSYEPALYDIELELKQLEEQGEEAQKEAKKEEDINALMAEQEQLFVDFEEGKIDANGYMAKSEELEARIAGVGQNIKYDEFEAEAEKFELDAKIQALYLKRDKIIREQINILLVRKYRHLLKTVSPLEAYAIKSKLGLDYDQWEMGITFKLPGCNDAQIKHLKQERDKLNQKHQKVELFKIDQRIKTLSMHTLVMIPVQKAVFAARVMNDKTRDKLPELPKPVKDYLKDNEMSLTQYMEKVYAKFPDESIEEREEALKRDAMFDRYRFMTDVELIAVIEEILTYLCIPPGEEYNHGWAKARQPYFKKLNAAKAMSMINFTYAVRVIWNANTAISSIRESGKSSKNLSQFQNVRRLVESMAGLRLWRNA